MPMECVEARGYAVNQNCVQVAETVAPASNTDALAAAIAAQSNAMAAQANNLTIFNFVFAAALAVAAITWGFYVRDKAKRMAKEAADNWMDANAPGVIADIFAKMSVRQPEEDDQGDALSRDPAKGDGT